LRERLHVLALVWPEKPAIPPFFKFGTPPAIYLAHTDTDPRRPTMFAAKTSQNLFAAAISVSFSAILFAYAIIPASPTLMA
jgi:hypothetical protein